MSKIDVVDEAMSIAIRSTSSKRAAAEKFVRLLAESGWKIVPVEKKP